MRLVKLATFTVTAAGVYALFPDRSFPPSDEKLVLTDWSVEMSPMPDPRFELRRITSAEWLILDHRYGSNDARRNVACVYAVDESEVIVTWLRDLPLALCYQTPFDVLEDVQRFYGRDRSQRPIPIPHMPPRLATA